MIALPPDASVEALVGALPVARPVLDRLEVPLAPGRTIAELSARAAIPAPELVRLLQGMTRAGLGADLSLGAVLAHVEAAHHVLARRELARAGERLARLARVADDQGTLVREIAGLVTDLEGELLSHMSKEERVVFPYLRALEAAAVAGRPMPVPPFLTLRNPLRVLEREHQAIALYLGRLEAVTGGWRRPAPNGEGSDGDRAGLLAGLRTLAEDLDQHMLLEEHLVFRVASALEPRVLAPD